MDSCAAVGAGVSSFHFWNHFPENLHRLGPAVSASLWVSTLAILQVVMEELEKMGTHTAH